MNLITPGRSNTLPFRFNQQKVATLQTLGTFSSSSSDSGPPILAYLDPETLRFWRNESIKLSASDYAGPQVASLQQKKQRRIQPRNKVEDPYIVAILVALAQEQKRRQGTEARPSENVTMAGTSDLDPVTQRFRSLLPRSISGVTEMPKETMAYFKTHLLAVTPGTKTDGQSLYFYTARIPAAFLDRFDRPSQYFPCDPILISYYRIPLESGMSTIAMIRRVISAVRQQADKK
ncbi:hypothetical protein B0I35DRAFT_485415 [Stachybotrys elegans]|uniref:Uncharacterized protein n=1 Tax=Stachybotrys elegans TaxID=80388 RepID=A0A8K0SAY5_9HYPO|nr:hypothetical protein B0I35DRAFT_485516 [Stachybotrys elegans]KAH7303124.1 hypothetical protein B0I35DRAFT_485415 [Stachybotrys elegans]